MRANRWMDLGKGFFAMVGLHFSNLKIKTIMDWKTIYITGNANFWEEVNKKLERSTLKFLLGSLEQSPDNKFIGLYWLDANADVNELKTAIGDKVISKWSLSFGKEWGQTKNEKSSPRNLKGFSMLEAK